MFFKKNFVTSTFSLLFILFHIFEGPNMWQYFVIFVFFCNSVSADPISVAAMVLSGASAIHDATSKPGDPSLLGSIFAPSDSYRAESATIKVSPDMNNGSAVKLHVVIGYSKELASRLAELNSDQYFRLWEQLKRDYPEEIKIISTEIVAKQQILPLKLDYPTDNMEPECIFIFASYTTYSNNFFNSNAYNSAYNNVSNNSAQTAVYSHRAKIHKSWEKILIKLNKDTFEVMNAAEEQKNAIEQNDNDLQNNSSPIPSSTKDQNNSQSLEQKQKNTIGQNNNLQNNLASSLNNAQTFEESKNAIEHNNVTSSLNNPPPFEEPKNAIEQNNAISPLDNATTF